MSAQATESSLETPLRDTEHGLDDDRLAHLGLAELAVAELDGDLDDRPPTSRTRSVMSTWKQYPFESMPVEVHRGERLARV